MRFYNYDKIQKELNEIRQLLQSGESGISPDRTIQEFSISPRGDAILEFANNGMIYPLTHFNHSGLNLQRLGKTDLQTTGICLGADSGSRDCCNEITELELSAKDEKISKIWPFLV